MQKLKSLMIGLGVAALFSVSIQVSYGSAEKGYSELSKPNQEAFSSLMREKTKAHVVYEFFSFACHHCKDLEPKLDAFEAHHSDIEVVKIPVTFGQEKGPWYVTAKAYYIALALDESKKLNPAIFKAIHDDKENIFTEGELETFYKKQGVAVTKFRSLYNSFGIDQQMRKNVELIKRLGITGVPTIVVDGKYMTSAQQAGGVKEMFKVVETLTQKTAKQL